MRARLAQATVRALSGVDAATLAMRRSFMTKEPPVCRTPIHVSEGIFTRQNQDTRSFAEGNPMEGTEALTDAVRAALGYIAARREWPHGTQTDLYDVTTALATGTLPEDDDKASELLDSAPEEGIDLCSAFAASMGQPASVKFGMFYDSRDGCDADATMFARRSIELARRLGREKAVAS